MKKMDITVSERDKKLLVILAAVVIGFLLYTFVMDPALNKGSELKSKADIARAELKRVNNLVDNLSSIQTEEADKKKTMLEKYNQFFYDLNQEQIMYKMDSLFQESGLMVTSYKPSELVVSSITPINKEAYVSYPLLDLASKSNVTLTDPIFKIKSDKAAAQTATSTEIPADAIPAYDVSINFSSSSYASVMTFIKKLEEMNKTIVIKKLDIHQSAASVSGEIVITLYSLPKVNESESEYLKFIPSVGTGKADPFH